MRPARTAGLGLALAVGLFALGRGTAPAAAEPYHLGAVLSETGPAATLGRPEAAAMRLAVDEINRSGGVNGHPLQLTVIDDESQPTNTVNGVRRLIDQKVVGLMAGSTTPATMAIIPLVEQAHLPLINFASSADAITPVAQRRFSFKDSHTDTQGAQYIQRELKARGLLKVGMLYRNDGYGKDGVEHFKQVGAPQGFQVVDAEAVDFTATDVTTQLTRLRAASPQVIVIWSTLPNVVVAAKNYKQLGMTIPVYFSDGAADAHFTQLTGSAADGMRVLTLKIVVADQLPASDPQRALLLRFRNAFAAVDPQDSPASVFAAFGYDAPYWMREALLKAGGTDPEKMRDALEHVQYTGAAGVFRTAPDNHNGFQPSGFAMLEIRNGAFVLQK